MPHPLHDMFQALPECTMPASMCTTATLPNKEAYRRTQLKRSHCARKLLALLSSACKWLLLLEVLHSWAEEAEAAEL